MPSPINVPNFLTALRLVLSVVLFVVLAIAQNVTGTGATEGGTPARHLYLAGLGLFVVAAGTDWLDGYWARRYGQVTMLGRIFDPFVDKIIVCGTFIFLAAAWPRSGVAAWMAVLIVGRELLVTALRSFLEQRGTDFSASLSGKLKMLIQCVAVCASLYALSRPAVPSPPAWLAWTVTGLVWAAIVITVYSGLGYLRRAAVLLRE